MATDPIDIPNYDSLPAALRSDVRRLGAMLGRVIANDRGDTFLQCIETIRQLAKDARGRDGAWDALSEYLRSLPEGDLVDVSRAFNQFLNLANIAEQHHQTYRRPLPLQANWVDLAKSFDLADAIESTTIELVLTAHPTEVLRRTLIQKYDAIAALMTEPATATRDVHLERLIAEAWHSDEIRHEQPTPQDEAKWGFTVVEQSLWFAVPEVFRQLDGMLGERGQEPLALDVVPMRFASWMGGDRDGNPRVTSVVTAEVLLLARWMAADLFLRDVEELNAALSMTQCNAAVSQRVGDQHEPYRALLRDLRDRLRVTRDWAEGRAPLSDAVILDDADLLEPLTLCFDSLVECGMEAIARGPLLDTIRRAQCFGVTLVSLDVRQNADRHEQVFDELTRYFQPDEASYGQWDEDRRQQFLLEELANKRPLFPAEWPMSDDVREVLDTCRVIAGDRAVGISEYIISMAASPSDVLEVICLLRESGFGGTLPVVPLFETLDDLDGAAATLEALLSVPWYRDYVRDSGDRQQVMIGYSDSAKDAGQLAAAWAQYRAQEQLAKVANGYGVKLVLFHGRGGAVGRGGGPAHQAILSQPPGTLGGAFRVTEQGEMIRFKLGTPAVAVETLSLYLQATIEATLDPPPEPTDDLRETISRLADASVHGYRETVRDGVAFVPFFQSLTPERELAELSLGSRPARRKPTQDIESLRAIPWVFAWTQVRLMIPAWLGTEAAVNALLETPDAFSALAEWPFFRMQTDMLEMMLAKADPALVRYYASRLTDAAQQALAEGLIGRLEGLRSDLLTLKSAATLLADQAQLADSLLVRNTYLDPLHLLQAELLYRLRSENAPSDAITQALKVTMAGISSGLRNTG